MTEEVLLIQQYNYLKLLEDLSDCYDKGIRTLQVPYSCIKDYPIDMANKLLKLGCFVDLKSDCLYIELKTNPLTNKQM